MPVIPEHSFQQIGSSVFYPNHQFSFYLLKLNSVQKILDPAAGKAMEVQEDLKQGYYNGEQESGDGPEAGDEQKKPTKPQRDTDSHG